MGCTGSTEGDKYVDKDKVTKSREIDRGLRKDKTRMENEIKLLLLGAGESGKSTFVKQMRIIHEKGYSGEGCQQFKRSVYQNVVSSMQVLLEAMERLGISFDNPERKTDADVVNKLSDDDQETLKFTSELAEALQRLWGDEGVQTCYGRSREFQLNDSAGYFLGDVERIAKSDYVPTETDILRVRVKTTGISESSFEHMDHTFRVFDVGGQRSERKKWMHCFEDVTAVIFLAALSAYDLVLREDENTNRMEESLTLFDDICNNKWFVKTSVVLFLNKTDLFEQKLKTSPLSKYFKDYTGGDDFEAASGFIRKKFEALNRSSEKFVYTHLTCATDTENIRFVFQAVSDIILSTNLKSIGLL